MNLRLELGRIAGIPIYLDMFFVLVLLFFSHRYFTSGDSLQLSAGIIIIAGIVVSILLHELGHALAAWLFRTRVAEIELTGLGGVIHFDTSLPRSVLPRMLIFLAGPAVNYGLYWAMIEAVPWSLEAEKPVVTFVLVQLATINFFLCLFNLLPAFPLDGGQALDALLGRLFGPTWGRRIVGALGIVVALVIAFFAIQSLPGSIFLLLLAYVLADANWTALQGAGR